MRKTNDFRKLFLSLVLCAGAPLGSAVLAQGPGGDGMDYGDSSGFEGRGDFPGGRRGFGGGWERGGWGDRGGFGERGGDFEGRGFGRGRGFGQEGGWGDRQEEGAPSESGGNTRTRISIPLPETYLPADRDRDGQIGLYEWRQWRRGDMQSFLALDHNGDGFLTPAELVRGPKSSNTISLQTAVGGGDSTQPVSLTSGQSPAAGSSSSSGADFAKIGASRFNLIDRNRNGSIDPDEWKAAASSKAQFEKAGIDLGSPMSKDDFIKHFVEQNTPKAPGG